MSNNSKAESSIDPSLLPFLKTLPTLEINPSSAEPNYLTPYRQLLNRSWVQKPFPRKAELPNGLAFKPIIIDRKNIKLDHDYIDRAYLDVRYYDVAPWLAARKDQSETQNPGQESEKLPQPAIIYFHAGSLVSGSSDMFDEFLHKLALESGCKIFSVEYRLAPERSFPAAVLDAVLAIEYIMHLSDNLNVDLTSVSLLGSGSGGSDLIFLAAAHQIRRQSITKLPSIRFLIASSSTGDLFSSSNNIQNQNGNGNGIGNDKGKSKAQELEIPPLILSSSDPDFSKEIQNLIFNPTTELSLMLESHLFGQWKSISLINDYEIFQDFPKTLFLIPSFDSNKDQALSFLKTLQEKKVKTYSIITEGAVHLSMEIFPEAEISIQMRQALIKELKENLI